MILPSLRGHEEMIADHPIEILCKKCGCQRVLYRKKGRARQVEIPAFCLKCGSWVVFKVVQVTPGGKDACRFRSLRVAAADLATSVRHWHLRLSA